MFFDRVDGSFVSADFNLDGIDDVLTRLDFDLATLAGSASGFQSPLATSGVGGRSVCVADMNGDNIPDLVGGVFYSFQVALGDGQGQFAINQSVSLEETLRDLSCADFNIDGNVDVLTARHFLSLFLGVDNAMVSESHQIILEGYSPSNILSVDLNFDGFVDLAFIDGDSVVVMLNQLGATVLIGDVNLDGLVNLLDVGPFVEVLVNQ